MSTYDAFISYRQGPPDKDVAVSLHRALERYRVPRSLCRQKGIAHKIHKIFRDEDELAAGELTPRLRKALEQSRHLIVICSTRTPSSEWVAAEIEYFHVLGRHDKILPVLLDGEPEQSYPEPIRRADVLGADIRPPTHWRSRLKKEKLRLVASMLGCDFDDLVRRHQKRFVRTSIAAGFLILSVAAVVLLSIHSASVANRRATALQQIEDVRAELQAILGEEQRRPDNQSPRPEVLVVAARLDEMLRRFETNVDARGLSDAEDLLIRNAKATVANAQQEHRRALELVSDEDEQFSISGSVKILETRASAYYGLRDWQAAMERYEKVLKLQPHRIRIKTPIANCYRMLGQLPAAVALYDEIVEHFSELVEENRSDVMLDLAVSLNNRAGGLSLIGKHDAAIVDYGRAIEIYTQLVSEESRNELSIRLALSHIGRGTAYRVQQNLKRAVDDYNVAIEILLGEESQAELASALSNRGRARQILGELNAAVADYDDAIDIYERLVSIEGRTELSEDMAGSYAGRGTVHRVQMKLTEAIADLDRAINVQSQLVSGGRTEIEPTLADSYVSRGNARHLQPKPEIAVDDYNAAIQIYKRLAEENGRTELSDELAVAHVDRGLSYRDLGKLETAIEEFGKAIAIQSGLVDDGRTDVAQELARSYSNRGFVLLDKQSAVAAAQDHAKALEIINGLIKEGRDGLSDDLAICHMGFGRALQSQGKLDEAIEAYTKGIDIYAQLVNEEGRLELKNLLAKSHMDRGNARGYLTKLDAALKDYDIAIEIRTELVEQEGRRDLIDALAMSHGNRALARSLKGKLNDAIEDYEKVIQLERGLVESGQRPDLANNLAATLNSVAWYYATNVEESSQNSERAIQYAKQACIITQWKKSAYIDTLAASFARADRFEEAVEWQLEAIRMAHEDDKEELNARLELYKSGKRYRHPPAK